MLLTVLIAAAACIAMLVLVFFFPSVSIRRHFISTYWFAPLVGGVLLWLLGRISGGEILEGLTQSGGINPIQLLVLFLSMTLLSVFLDQAGFFSWLASKVLRRAGSSQKKLFISLYLMVSVLTVFTSNDVVILTFTPFLCFFSKGAKIDPLPFLVAEFVAANTWSMGLLIGNPTNICLCTAGNVEFLAYLRVMWFPTLLAGTVSFFVLRLMFRKSLQKPMEPCEEEARLSDVPAVVVAILHLAVCIVLLVFSNFLAMPMWLITLVCFISLYVSMTLYLLARKKGLRMITDSFRRAPWEIVPFVLSMFVVVLALEKAGATEALAALLSKGESILTFGVSSFFAANLVNNIPMSVFYSAVVAAVPSSQTAGALYAAVAGSNLGAYLTPIGALAGILWMSLLSRYGVKMSFGKFIRYCAPVSLCSMAAALLGLWLVIYGGT